jgi:hypothetical protein
MLNFVENLLENERDPRSGPMNDQDHSLSFSDPVSFDQDLRKTDYDPDRSLVLSHFLTNFLQNLASCHTALIIFRAPRTQKIILIFTTLHSFLIRSSCPPVLLTLNLNFQKVKISGVHLIFW